MLHRTVPHGSMWLVAAGAVLAACRGSVIVADMEWDSGGWGDTDSVAAYTAAGSDAAAVDSDSAGSCSLPDAFAWTAPQEWVAPPEGADSIKDPTVVFDGSRWHLAATARRNGGLTLVHATWNGAGAPTAFSFLADTAGIAGYAAAPQLFYFSPQGVWYLVYQSPDPTYVTSSNPADPASWSAPQRFFSIPQSLVDAGASPIDYWVICDATRCHLFFSGLDGALYRAVTAKDRFPDGFSDVAVVMRDTENPFHLFDASNVYRVGPGGPYLLLVSAIGVDRYFRAWVADGLDGPWVPLADTENHAFLSAGNVAGMAWALSGPHHGEVWRIHPDETMTIDPCALRYAFSAVTSRDAETGDGFSLGLAEAAW